MHERDEAEFRRTGSSSYTRACELAPELWAEALTEPASDELRSRIRDFGRQIAHLASYRDDLPMVALPGGLMVELVAVPGLLGARAGSRGPMMRTVA